MKSSLSLAVVSLAVVAALALPGCQRPASGESEPAAPAADAAPPATSAAPAESVPPPPIADDLAVPPPLQQASLAGFGDMKLGSGLDEARAAWGGELKSLGSGAIEPGACHYLVPKWAKDANALAFMMEGGKFVRYDVGNDKETAPGGGKVGMTVDELQKLYHGGLQASPHKYVEGAQYLSMAASGVAPTRLVFETDAAGKVIRWRVGLPPQADYVEGCS